MKLAVLVVIAALLLGGCNLIFGVEPPRHLDASFFDAPIDAPSTVDAPDGAPPGMCPSTYTYSYGSSRYRLVTVLVNWQTAAMNCSNDGATGDRHTHLVVVGDEPERGFIKSIEATTFWIGLSDRVTEGQFVWVTDENTNGYPGLSRPPWAVPEPTGLGEDCGATANNGTGQFEDDLCSYGEKYICECDGDADDPTNYTP